MDDFLPFWHQLHLRRFSNWALAIASIHEQPFPLTYRYRIIDQKDISSAAQTNDLRRSGL